MGAWGYAPFENDAALDWMSWAGDDTNEAVDSALRQAVAADYLDVDQGSAAVAAAAIVAAAYDGDVESLPGTAATLVDEWQSDEAIIELALDALTAVVGPQSELASLWGEGTGGGAWKATIEQLRKRLARAQSVHRAALNGTQIYRETAHRGASPVASSVAAIVASHEPSDRSRNIGRLLVNDDVVRHAR
jgi:hypothetical protein